MGVTAVGLGVAEHRPWVYIAGIAVLAAAIATLLWQAWTRWRGHGWGRWLVAATVGVVVAVPSIAVPWQAHRAQQPERADWLVERTTVEQYAVDGMLYTRDDTGAWYVIDARSGEVTADIKARDDVGLSVGPNGLTYRQTAMSVTAYDPAGVELWRRPGNAVAATDRLTVVRHCFVVTLPPSPCPVRGVDSETGQVRWSRQLIIKNSAERRRPGLPAPSGPRTARPTVLPQVVVARASREPNRLEIVDAATGDTIQRMRADAVGISGDLVVGATVTDGGCVLRGYRGTETAWRSAPIPGCPQRRMRLLESRLYVHPSAGETITVDLTDGSWRRCGRVELDAGEYENDNRTGEGSDDVIVYRDGPGAVFGVDADTGEELWRHEVPGDRPAGLDVGHGAVVVLTPAESHNPFVSEAVADGGYRVTVLDARTGETTGRWTGPEVQEMTAVAPGRAVVTVDGRTWPIGSR